MTSFPSKLNEIKVGNAVLKSYFDKIQEIVTAAGISKSILDTNLNLDVEKEDAIWKKYAYEPYKSLFSIKDLGIPDKGDMRPTDNGDSGKYKESDKEKTVYLVVTTSRKNKDSRDNHWAIRWRIPDMEDRKSSGTEYIPLARMITLFHNPQYKTSGQQQQLTNWGAMTKQADKDNVGISLGKLSLAQRKELEAIAWNTPVAHPTGNGDYNCQNWILGVLGIAVARGILDAASVEKAIKEALKDTPSG